MLRVFQHQPLTCMCGQLIGQLFIAYRKQEFFRDHTRQCCQKMFAFPGFAKPSAFREFLQQPGALTRRVRPAERDPGIQTENRDQGDQHGQKSKAYFSHEFRKSLMNSVMGTSCVSAEQYSAQRLANVNHESIFDIASLHPLIGKIDVLHRDDLDIGHDLMLTTKIQHLLRLFNAAHQ